VEHNLARRFAMFGSSASDLHPEQRRSRRFPFDSLVRVAAFRLGEEAQSGAAQPTSAERALG